MFFLYFLKIHSTLTGAVEVLTWAVYRRTFFKSVKEKFIANNSNNCTSLNLPSRCDWVSYNEAPHLVVSFHKRDTKWCLFGQIILGCLCERITQPTEISVQHPGSFTCSAPSLNNWNWMELNCFFLCMYFLANSLFYNPLTVYVLDKTE